MEALNDAMEIVGTGELSAALGVSRNAPLMWRRRKSVPIQYRPAIENLTGGRVRVEHFGADVRWVRVKDPKWPVRKGRPLADFSGSGRPRAGGTP